MTDKKLANLSILLVEDIRAMRLLIRTVLQTFGISHIVEAADGTAALKLLRTERVDVVITDLCMQPMDGIEFTRCIRRPDNNVNSFVPVLAVSSSTEAGRVKEAIDAGVTAFLAKPISVAELQKKLTMVMRPPRRLVTSENYCGPDRRRSTLPTRLRRRNTDFDIVEL